LAGTVFPNFATGATPIMDFLCARQRCQRKGGNSNCDLVQINHGVSFSGSNAALLRVIKTYANGPVHHKSVPAIVPQGFTPSK
jgi:hypothetical protein